MESALASDGRFRDAEIDARGSSVLLGNLREPISPG